MPFWSDNFGEGNALKDPKRQFRFKVEFTGISAPQGGSLLWYAKTVNKPSFTIETAEHQYGYNPPSNPNSLGTMSKSKAAGALGTVYISQIDGDGAEIEKWTLWNGFITSVKYGDLAYGTDDLVEMTLELRYDWARVETLDGVSRATAGSEGTTFFQS